MVVSRPVTVTLTVSPQLTVSLSRVMVAAGADQAVVAKRPRARAELLIVAAALMRWVRIFKGVCPFSDCP